MSKIDKTNKHSKNSKTGQPIDSNFINSLSEEEKYKNIFEQAVEGIFQSTPDGRYISVNPSYASMLGYSSPEEIISTVKDIGAQVYYDPEDREHFLHTMETHGEVRNLEVKQRRKDGTAIWVSLNARAIKDDKGNTLYFQGVVENISERKELEEKLRQSEAWYRTIFETSSAAMIILEEDTTISLVNENAIKLAGYTREEIEGKMKWTDFVVKEDLAFMKECHALRRKDPESAPKKYEFRLIDKQGTIHNILLNINMIPGTNKSIASLLDITEQKKVEQARIESETKLKSIIEHSNELFYIHDTNHVFTYVSPQSYTLLGYTPDELMIRWTDIATNNPINIQALELTEKAITTGQRQEPYLAELYKKDGGTILIEVDESPILDAQGKTIAITGAARDVTEKKQMEEALRRSEEKYRSIFENATEGIFQTTPEGKIITANPSLARIFGYASTEEGVSYVTSIDEQVYAYPEDRKRVKELLDTAGEVKNYEVLGKKKDGTPLWLSINARAVKDTNGKTLYYEGTLEDITEFKQREEERQREYIRNKALLQLYQMSEEPIERITHFVMEHCILITGSEYGFIGYINEDKTLMNTHLWSKKVMEQCEVDGRPVVFPIEKAGLWAETIRQRKPIMVNNYKDPSPYKKRYPEGHVPIERFLGIPVVEKDHVPVIIGLANKKEPYNDTDVLHISLILEGLWGYIKKKQTEDALRASEERYRTLIESSNDAIVIVKGGRHVFVNKRFYDLTGYSEEEIINQPIDLWISPEDKQNVLAMATQREKGVTTPSRYEFKGIRKDGSIVHIEVSATQIILHGETMVLAILRDITELKRTEAQLIQSQKMEAIGRLAGGIAHDFNNMLTVMLGHAQLAQLTLEPSNPLYQRFKDIQKVAERSAELTKNLLAFARKQTITPKVLNMNNQIEDMLNMLRRLIGENIELLWLTGSNLWDIKIDPAQLNQIIINIVINAKDAIERYGRITIETGNATIDENYCKTHLGFIPGEYTMVAISDNGIGMEKEVLEHIFEPFFTTKGLEKGSGLGLSTVYGIVKQNNGFINVYSESGKGSTFKIYLPRYIGDKKEKIVSEKHMVIESRGETVLLVEDEADVLELCSTMLEQLGYTVISAQTPNEAINKSKAYEGEIHILITDVIMPEINGKDLADILKAMRPSIKCLFMSGYTANAIVKNGILQEGVNYIQKPFSIQEFSRKVRAALEN
ncbi:MAG: PAS domain S-box protein [Syntrophorhabdaceae bacterium]|nr:PAS domain S-box protein [Syntrophorhabdaceae bacterium]